ncbi:hypothetical protein [Fictibacillus sp. NRS-1165]|uniref:hypothetical protein n=1 Tax=Fictibacillus sp. NRS-1165 TaxID=3144463 RepID=UPI003D23D6B4
MDVAKEDLSQIDKQVQQGINEINEELEVNPTGVWDKLNAWSLKILETPTSLKENKPFILLTMNLIILLFNFVIVPAVQDEIKNKVFHENPTQDVKEIKNDSSHEYSEATNYINKVRITNRVTPVYRSDKRKSGKIDTIPIKTPIIIVHKKKNWSYVMYVNQYKEEVTGWVFTGNIER